MEHFRNNFRFAHLHFFPDYGFEAGGGGIEKRQFEAKDGFKGVLVTCAGKHKEGQTVRELFNLFNEVHDHERDDE